ncbi:unnamed protein product [Cuscuta campestris]|uniref:Uncharacterized protein n=1 Tax=Cuscuta campestris TaxID=132261 RepID=A0A484KTT5_9ASTE|nr:unnamed protein product [Cuscuta campestris]
MEIAVPNFDPRQKPDTLAQAFSLARKPDIEIWHGNGCAYTITQESDIYCTQGVLPSAVAFAVGEAFSVLTLEHHRNRHLLLPRSPYSMPVATWRLRSRAEEAAKEETEFQRRLVRCRTGIFRA